MKDQKDKKTVDAFKRGRGRPATRSPEQKAAQVAAAMRAYRKRNAIKKAVFERLIANPKDADIKVLYECITRDQDTKFKVYDEWDMVETPIPVSAWEAAEAIYQEPDWSVRFQN